MKILSWNIKSFVSCVNNATEGLTVLKAVLNQYDVIAIYEVSLSDEGKTAIDSLKKAMPGYSSFEQRGAHVDDLPDGERDDLVLVFWKNALLSVTNTTAGRRSTNYNSRAPVYFEVTENASKKKWEFCAWHAPRPNLLSDILAGWQQIKEDSQQGDTHLTTVIMGDFNANLADPYVSFASRGVDRPPKRGKPASGSFLKKQILRGSTTLKPNVDKKFANPIDYRTETENLYDQFFLDISQAVDTPGSKSGIYDVIKRLKEGTAPLDDDSLSRYRTDYLTAYKFYKSHLSDHLPVALEVTFQ